MFGRKKNTTTTTTTTRHADGPRTTSTTSHAAGTKHRRPWHYPLIFILLFVFGVVELGLVAHMVHLINSNQVHFVHQMRRRYKYTLFVAVWTVVLSLVWLGIAMATFLFRWLHHTIFLFLTMIFWLIAAALLEVRTRGFLKHLNYCSSFLGNGRCREMRTINAFAWILFALSLLAIPLCIVLRHKERQDIRHRSDPNMQASQTALNPTYGHTGNATTGHHHIGHAPASTRNVEMRPVV